MSSFRRRRIDASEVRSLNDAIRQANVQRAALERARHQGPLALPAHWPSDAHRQFFPQTAAFLGTRFVRISRGDLPPLPYADAVAARTQLVFRAPTGFERRVRDSQNVVPGTMRPHGAFVAAVGTPIATIHVTSGSDRSRQTSQYIVQVDELLDQPFETPARAAVAARDLMLQTTPDPRPVGIVGNGAGGVRLARIALPSILQQHQRPSPPLVGAVAGTSTTIRWSGISTTLHAVIGVDGVLWL